jgi:hypothetical protein
MYKDYPNPFNHDFCRPKPTPAAIEHAFKDLMNGTSAGDICRLTGLPEARCEEIYNLYRQLPD